MSFSGEHYQLSDHRAWPRPTQQPRPPILIGGSGRRLLRLAAGHADIVSLSGLGRTRTDGRSETSGFSPDAVDVQVALVRGASGGPEPELQALVQRVVVTDDPRGSAELARERLPELSVEDILGSPYLWIGTVESIGEDILAARERWGFSYFTVFHDSLQAVSPIVARLGGK